MSLKLERSFALEAQARQKIGGLTQSLMKRPEQFCPGQCPVFLERGQGAEVWDVDGNRYVDYISGLAATTLGHNHPKITEAITSTLQRQGILQSLPTKLELDAADAVMQCIPNTEMVRFFKTGTDANTAALRMARHLTGRDAFISVGYNGWHDQYMFDTPGIPACLKEGMTHRVMLMPPGSEQKLIATIEEHGEQCAALLMSIPYNRELSREFLQEIRSLCTKKGVMWIVDEVVTGFRLALGGVQEHFDIQGDIITMSKGLAAGMPLSAVAGPRKHMECLEKLQVSTTFGGECLSLATCCAALSEYRRGDYIQELWRKGARLREGLTRASQDCGARLKVLGYDPMPMLRFAPAMPDHVPIATKFVGAMAQRGILMRRDVNFMCDAHSDALIDETIAAAREVLKHEAFKAP